MAVDSIKRAPPSALGMTQWQGCKAAGEQSKSWRGDSTEDKGPEDGSAGRPCREARRTVVWTEGPIGRDQLVACRLALSEWDSSD